MNGAGFFFGVFGAGDGHGPGVGLHLGHGVFLHGVAVFFHRVVTIGGVVDSVFGCVSGVVSGVCGCVSGVGDRVGRFVTAACTGCERERKQQSKQSLQSRRLHAVLPFIGVGNPTGFSPEMPGRVTFATRVRTVHVSACRTSAQNHSGDVTRRYEKLVSLDTSWTFRQCLPR